MSSKRKRFDRSHPRTAPPIVAASAPLTASPMPPTNSVLPNVYPSHISNPRMPSQSDIHLDLRLDPLLIKPGIPTGLETSTENTHSRPVHVGPGQIVPRHPFHVNAHVPTAHGFGRGIVPLSERILMPGERSASYGFPHRQDNDGDQATTTYTFRHENPGENLKKDTTDSEKKRQYTSAQRLTIQAGGACIWCFISKKKCDPEVPCEGCRRNERNERKGHDCVRGGHSSLCLALTVKHGNHFDLDPNRFKKAQETLKQLKQDLQPSSFPFVVRWIFRDQPYHETLILPPDQLELHQADPTLGKTIVDLAQRSIGVIRSPHVPEELLNDAHRILSLLAVMKRLFTSLCFTEAVTIKTARVIVFFLMTLYTMELCEVSLHLAKGLYHALNKKLSATNSKDYVIPAYIRTIDGILNLQWPNSLMSDIFTHVQPSDRLRNLRELLRQLVLDGGFESTSDPNESLESAFPQCDIMIEFPYEMRETLVPVGFTQGLRQAYAVKMLLRSDFEESMKNPITSPQTINPSLLSPELSRDNTIADHEASTALDSGDDLAIFSYGAETQNTETTSPPPDTPGFFASAYESTLATIPQDFAYMGNHLS